MEGNDWKELRKTYGEVMRKRATGELPEMAQVKQFMKLFRESYQSGMNVLDVGCGAGHFFTALQKLDPNIVYHGVDIESYYINIARDVWKGRSTASFSVGSTSAFRKLDAESFDVFLVTWYFHSSMIIRMPCENTCALHDAMVFSGSC